MKRLSAFAAALLLVSSASQALAEPPRPVDTREYVGKDSPVDAATLRFEDAADGARWARLRACMSARTDATWERYPLRRFGNFIQEDACRGTGAARGCAGGNFRERPGATWWSIATLHYPQSWPTVFGVSVDVGVVPDKTGIGAQLWWSEHGKSVLGEGLHVTFTAWSGGVITDKLAFGDGMSWTIGETTVRTTATGTRGEVLDRLLASPASLQTEALAQLDALEARVRDGLARDEFVRCTYGPYEGRGIPPACVRQDPVPKDERAGELDKLRKALDGHRALVKGRSKELHAVLMGLFGPGCR